MPVKSDVRIVTCGVLQGSVLGPLVLLIYVNYISENSLLSFLLFADDTNLFYSHRNPEILNQIANQKMCKVANWLRTNIFFLNISKTHFIIFKTENKEKPSNFEIKINKETFEQVNSTKFLGLIIEKSYPGNNILKKWKQKYQEC